MGADSRGDHSEASAATGRLRQDAAIPAGEAAAIALAWRFRGATRVTVVAKATFAFAPDLVMPRVAAQQVLREDVHPNNHPARSIRFAHDLAPYLPRADVLLTGTAHAPPGGGTAILPVRLGIFDGPRVVLDKTVMVRKAGGVDRVPLVYERAYGGVGFLENPLGVGAAGSGEPNLFDMMDAKRIACFAPIAASWPARKRLLGATPRQKLEQDVAEVPDAFDFSYFQSAPVDQRVDYLRGDEWIVVDGVNPKTARLRLRLPGARGLARIYGLEAFGVAGGQALALHLDTLRIDADDQLCTLTFRGTFEVEPAALGEVIVAAGVEVPGQPIAWPDVAARRAAAESPRPTTLRPTVEQFESVRGQVHDGTLAIEDEIAPSARLPFRAATGGPSSLSQPERSAADEARAHSGTAVANAPPAELRDVLPFLFDDEPARAEAPQPAPDPKLAPAASSPPKHAERGSPWAPQPAAPEPPKPKPAPPAPAGPAAALSSVKKGGYDRFKR